MSEEQQAPQRQFVVQRIYTKGLSFKAPNAPQIFHERTPLEPTVNIGTKVNRLNDTHFELVLKVSVEVKHGNTTVYLVEVHQCGVFSGKGFSEAELDALMGVAGPEILFPYAREAISDVVARGNFPQFIVQPVNFKDMYTRQRQANAAKAEDGSTAH